MATLDPNINTLEKAKFRLNADCGTVVATTDEGNFFLSVANDDFANVRSTVVEGDIPSFSGTDSPADVVPFLNPGLYTFPSAAATLSIVSDDAADTLLGTGARTLLIEGLDANFDEISETINMDGLTPVVTTNSYIRINKGEVRAVGSAGENVGNITIDHGVDTIGIILPGNGNMLQAIFTVPNNMTGFIIKISSSVHRDPTASAAGKEVIIRLKARTQGNSWQVKRIFGENTESGSYTPTDDVFKVVGARGDIRIEAVALNNGAAVSAAFNLILVENS